MMLFRKKNKNHTIDIATDLGPTLPADTVIPADPKFTKKFIEDGMDAYQKEYASLKENDLHVDDLVTERRSALLHAESEHEKAVLREEFSEQLYTALALHSEKFSEVVLILEKESLLKSESARLKKVLAETENNYNAWRDK